MTRPMPEQNALLDAVRTELGPKGVPPMPSPEEMQRRLEVKPWLDAPTSAVKPRIGGTLGSAAGILGICAIGIFGVHALVNSRSGVKNVAANMAPSSMPEVQTPLEPPAVETVPSTSLDSLPDAPILPRTPAPADRPGVKTSDKSLAARSAAATDTGSSVETPSASPDDALAAELALVHAARRALHDAAPKQAEELLSQHASRFPRGVLRDERMMLQALARCAQGDVDGARSIKADLEHTSPSSSHLRRLASSCAR